MVSRMRRRTVLAGAMLSFLPSCYYVSATLSFPADVRIVTSDGDVEGARTFELSKSPSGVRVALWCTLFGGIAYSLVSNHGDSFEAEVTPAFLQHMGIPQARIDEVLRFGMNRLVGRVEVARPSGGGGRVTIQVPDQDIVAVVNEGRQLELTPKDNPLATLRLKRAK